MVSVAFSIGGLDIVAQGVDAFPLMFEQPNYLPFRIYDMPSSPQLRWLLDAEVPAASGTPCFEMMLNDGRCQAFVGRDAYTLLLSSAVRELWVRYDLVTHTVSLSPTDYFPWLHFALWLAYNMQASAYGRFSLHCAAVVYHHTAVAFLGESGTGKSTHARLWGQSFCDVTLLNDDAPVFAAVEKGVHCYGSPWSGKTPCYRNEHYPLRGAVRLVQASSNKVIPLDNIRQVAALVPSFPPMLVCQTPFNTRMTKVISHLMRYATVTMLQCLPDRDAATLCRQALFDD